MSHQLQLLHTLKSPQLENKDSSSLLSASTDGVVQTSVIPVLSGKDLVASGGTSTVSIVEENIPAELVNGKPLNNVEKGSVASLLSVLKGTKESKTDEIRGDMTSVQTVSGDHANALLSVLKGKSRVETRPSPVENPLLVASSSRMKQVSSSQVSPKRSQNTFSKKNTRQRSPPTNNSSQSLINKDSNGPILPSNSPSITTAHQNSLLSLFNAPKSSSESSTSPSPQFNLHKESQVGKRRQFHDTLVPSGVKTRSSPLKSNDIDLGKMTLLKRASSKDERGTTPPTDPMGVEFVFRKRTLSKGDISPLDIQLTTDPVDTQESPPAMEDEEQVVDEREINQEDCLGTEREMKLVAMLERALARGA
jgi:hypothetical protein